VILASTPGSGLMPDTAHSGTPLQRRRAAQGARFPAGGARVACVPRLARPSPGRRPGIQPQAGEDLLDRCPQQDRRDDLQLPGAAARAAPHVDVEHGLVTEAGEIRGVY
jgi:hypothetical protein